MLQNSETEFKNPAALYKILKECPNTSENYAIKSLEMLWYQIKFLKIACYIFDFNQILFKSSFKKRCWSYYLCIFVSKFIPETCQLSLSWILWKSVNVVLSSFKESLLARNHAEMFLISKIAFKVRVYIVTWTK